MAKKRQLNDQAEMFALNAEIVEVNKTVYVEINNLIKKIDDEKNKKNGILCPKFKVGDTSLSIAVYPQDENENSEGYIGVYLINEENEKITATATFKHALGVEKTNKNVEMPAKTGSGRAKFLSHKAYKELAKDHGDVFKVEVEVTTHEEKGPAQWTSHR